MNKHYDALETRDPVAREAALMTALPGQVAHAKKSSAAFAKLLKNVNPAEVSSRTALAQLPVIRKHELLERQQASRSAGGDVFGGFSAVAYGARMPRIFSSPGPIYEPEGGARDYWRMARAIFSAGFRPGELIHNCFSYHFVPAGSMMESGAHAPKDRKEYVLHVKGARREVLKEPAGQGAIARRVREQRHDGRSAGQHGG